jgi:roadblock/LC7 domain-containing protein
VGERLNLDEKLISANGQFTLWLQPDGNLVLYHDAIQSNHAYWSSNTAGLPDNLRPKHADMQADAHFVLYDANTVPRWGSGTWGTGFVDPYIMLGDDGNLVIYHDGSQPVWASGGVDGVGQIPAAGM